MTATNKKDRSEAAKRAAETRRRNQLAAQRREMDDPHEVDHVRGRETAQDVAEAYDIDTDAPDFWSRPGELEAPPPRPGFVQRWIRYRVGTDEDVRNSQRKFREGWRPREARTVPEGYSPPTIAHAQWGDIIGVEDLILCEMPKKIADQRDAFYESKKDRMISGVEADLHKVFRKGPRLDVAHKSTSTLRRPRNPADE